MDSPRRSARLARNPPPKPSGQFTQTSRYSSASASAFPSPDNDLNQNTVTLHQTQSQTALYLPSSALQGSNQFNAPLPSPSTADMSPFFGRPHSQPPPFQPLHSSGGGQPQPQYYQQQQASTSSSSQQQQQQYTSHQQHQNSISHASNAQIPRNTGPGYSADFDVLAEAAKRAQMACLMRDIGDISL